MQYPHWLMVAGAVLVAFGFIGFAFRQKNRNAEPDEDNIEASNTPSESIQAALEAELKAKGK
jgi:hypothetical protein